MKIAFLDRDGTINRDYEDREWPYKKEPELLEGTIEGLNYLKERGYEFIIITNQYIIGEGYISYTDYHRFHKKLLHILSDNDIDILDTFYCPHSRLSRCPCCKPSSGLIEQAIKKYKDIDLSQSIFIGDSLSDFQLAQKVSLPFYGITLDCENRLNDLSQIRKYL